MCQKTVIFTLTEVKKSNLIRSMPALTRLLILKIKIITPLREATHHTAVKQCIIPL
jgi:hypothetical protein